MPHCPSYAELDALLKECDDARWNYNRALGPSTVSVDADQLEAIIKDLKQCRKKLAEHAQKRLTKP